MFNFLKKFNKKQEITTEPKTPTVKRKKAEGFMLPEPDLQALYKCSVQKTVKDFAIASISTDGGIVQVACDSMEELDDCLTQYKMQKAGQEIIFTYYAKEGFIGFNNCALLCQDWLVNKAICVPCDDAIAIDYDVNICNDEISDEDQTVLSDLISLSKEEKYSITKVCKKFAENKRKFGQSLCIPLVEGVDYSVPFNIDAVTQKSYKGMTVIEPIWVSPVLDIEASTNPTSKRYYQPTWFRLPNGKLIHYSWCIFNTYGEVSDILKASYYFGGYPLPQLLYEQVYAAHKTAKEAPMLAQSKRLNYLDANTNALLEDNTILHKLINLMSWCRNNWGWVIKKPDQSIGQLDTSLTDFDAVTMLGYQIVAAISGVQSARLLETSPKGWQSSGSLEDKNYSKLLENIQKVDFCAVLDFHYRLLAKSEFGLSKKFACIFDEIDNPTEKERAEIRKINADTDSVYINAGVVSPEEVRSVLRADEKSGYNALGEEMEGEPAEAENDLFNEEKGSETSPDFFNQDEWITVHPNGKENKGRHLFLEEGETPIEAVNRKWGKIQAKNTNENLNNIHKNLSSFEQNNNNLNYETGAVFDDNGNKIVEFSGKSHEIEVSDEDLKKLEGKIFTHNHPNNSTFSCDDIVTGFLKAKLKELRATTPNGIIFSLKPNTNNTEDLTKKMVAEYQQVSMRAARQFREKCIGEIKMGKLSLDNYNKNMYNMFQPYLHNKIDKFFEQHAEEYGFTYRKDSI